MRLPNKIKYTVTEHRTKTPYDAFLETLYYMLHNVRNLSPKTRSALVDALHLMGEEGSLSSCCESAFKRLRNLPITYVDEITEYFPPELWDLFDNRFNWEDE